MARAAQPRARAIPYAGAIAPAGPDFEAAGPDFEAAGPDLEAAGPDLEAARPDFEAARPDSEAAGPDSEAAGPDFEAEITGKHQKLSETGRRGSVWRDIGTIFILPGLGSLWDASRAPKRPKIAHQGPWALKRHVGSLSAL